MCLVLLIMCVHLRSVGLALLGFLHIVASLFVAGFVYSAVMGVRWLSFLDGLALFTVLGIGADDCFVFVDAWRFAVLDDPALFHDPARGSCARGSRAPLAVPAHRAPWVPQPSATSLCPHSGPVPGGPRWWQRAVGPAAMARSDTRRLVAR